LPRPRDTTQLGCERAGEGRAIFRARAGWCAERVRLAPPQGQVELVSPNTLQAMWRPAKAEAGACAPRRDRTNYSIRIIITALLMMPILQTSAADLQVFAAASLTDAMKEIGAGFEKQSGIHASFNFSASNLLARQIEEGAAADIFVSADEAKMDQLQKNG